MELDEVDCLSVKSELATIFHRTHVISRCPRFHHYDENNNARSSQSSQLRRKPHFTSENKFTSKGTSLPPPTLSAPARIPPSMGNESDAEYNSPTEMDNDELELALVRSDDLSVAQIVNTTTQKAPSPLAPRNEQPVKTSRGAGDGVPAQYLSVRERYIQDGQLSSPEREDAKFIEVAVGVPSFNPRFNYTQRTFHLPASRLAEHSAYMKDLIERGEKKIVLPRVDPRTFQDFVDFMYAGIYSLNTRARDFDAIRANTDAWILGETIKAGRFRDAAIRKLHAFFEPLARSPVSSAGRSNIRASDIEYVCKRTELKSPLRLMFIHAVAAHWTLFEAMNIGSHMHVDSGGNNVSWLSVFNEHIDFRSVIAWSLKFKDAQRCNLLGPVEDFLGSKTADKEEDEEEDKDG